MSSITDLKPQIVWQYFNEITKVPRPSKHEERIILYLVEFAEKHALECVKDAIGNVVIRKPATVGMETRPTVVLQSHVDMVCEKNSDVEFNFMTDAISAYVSDGWVKARGTTLGADCGIGMAAQLAVLASNDLIHGPLECLFTVDEETGLTGAFNLSGDMLKGSILLNLDSEDEGELFIGCAGGIDTVAYFDYNVVNPKYSVAYTLRISGLSGGHSGDDINRGLANSNKLIARMLWNFQRECGIELVTIDGGNLRNAIPREAVAVFTSGGDLQSVFERLRDEIKAEFRYTEPKMSMELVVTDVPDNVIDSTTFDALIGSIYACQNGVLAMSRTMAGMVETSTNLASVKMAGGQIVVTTSQRSSVESAKRDAAARVECAFKLAGAAVKHSDGYPGWEPNPASPLIATSVGVYSELFGVEPKVKAIHAGLECGLFLEKYPNLDMISFGPTLRGVHSPDEALDIDSVERFWQYLVRLLQKI